LITLALQNAFLTIIMHYSRISASPDKTYSAAAAVLLNELLKGSISVLIALRKIDHDLSVAAAPAIYGEKESRLRPSPRSSRLPTLIHSSRLRVLSKSIFSPDCYTLAVPAILYVIQNNLQYVAASNLDVATFQVTYQMKILTTAFFSVFILRKRLSRAKWLALVLLAVGVGIVQIQSTSAPAHSTVTPDLDMSLGEKDGSAAIAEAVLDERVMHPFKGFMAVTAACLTSGLAGVYFEFILKGGGGGGPAPDLWIRNTQLSLFSLVPALVPILVSPAGAAGTSWFERVTSTFSNFNGWAVGTVLTQTFGGLITAVVIRYSDNIMYVTPAVFA
jgi:UDP-sugar transporter A1/2/3